MDEKKKRASEWFSSLQTQLIKIFEEIENEATHSQYDQDPGRFPSDLGIEKEEVEESWLFWKVGYLKKQV